EQMQGELKRMQRETLSLELSLQRYTGEDLNSVQFGDLHELEQKLENAVNKVRERKGKMLHDENENLYHLNQLKENQVALDHQAALDQHQQMTMVPKASEDRRRVLESFPFSGKSNLVVFFLRQPCLHSLIHIVYSLLSPTFKISVFNSPTM
ncbi:mads-box protein fbp24, partial [Quercus suber]